MSQTIQNWLVLSVLHNTFINLTFYLEPSSASTRRQNTSVSGQKTPTGDPALTQSNWFKSTDVTSIKILTVLHADSLVYLSVSSFGSFFDIYVYFSFFLFQQPTSEIYITYTAFNRGLYRIILVYYVLRAKQQLPSIGEV